MGEVLHGSLLQLLLEHCDFLNIDISQGSVATRLRRGGIFKYELVANLPARLPVKEFWKSVNIWGSYGQEFGVLFYLRHSVLSSCSSTGRRRPHRCCRLGHFGSCRISPHTLRCAGTCPPELSLRAWSVPLNLPTNTCFWAHQSAYAGLHFDWLIRVCSAHGYNQQADHTTSE